MSRRGDPLQAWYDEFDRKHGAAPRFDRAEPAIAKMNGRATMVPRATEHEEAQAPPPSPRPVPAVEHRRRGHGGSAIRARTPQPIDAHNWRAELVDRLGDLRSVLSARKLDEADTKRALESFVNGVRDARAALGLVPLDAPEGPSATAKALTITTAATKVRELAERVRKVSARPVHFWPEDLAASARAREDLVELERAVQDARKALGMPPLVPATMTTPAKKAEPPKPASMPLAPEWAQRLEALAARLVAEELDLDEVGDDAAGEFFDTISLGREMFGLPSIPGMSRDACVAALRRAPRSTEPSPHLGSNGRGRQELRGMAREKARIVARQEAQGAIDKARKATGVDSWPSDITASAAAKKATGELVAKKWGV